MYHARTTELAIFEDGGIYWIGGFNPNLPHQNGEPPYYWITGDFDNEHAAINKLNAMTGNEF